MTMRVSLHAADLHYGGNLVLHTASSGVVPHLEELYLRIDDGDVVGVGEVRANIAYLNGIAADEVRDAAVAAIVVVDWWRIGLKHHQATTQGGHSTMRACSRLNCLQGQDLRVLLALFGSDPVHRYRTRQ